MGRFKHQGLKIALQQNWDVNKFGQELEGYQDQQILQFIKFGWPIDCVGIKPLNYEPNNHKGANNFPQEVKCYLKTEIKNGSIIGPFISNPFDKYTRILPLNTREKPETIERRIISDLSHPPGRAVNDYIPKGVYLGEDRDLSTRR